MCNPEPTESQVVVLTTARPTDPDLQEQLALFKALVVTVQHFFGGFEHLFQGLTDRRDQARITYPLSVLMATGVLMFLFRLGARRQIAKLLRGNGPAAAKYHALFGTQQCPHGDTLNYAFGRVTVAEAQEAVTHMTETLIRRKILYRHRRYRYADFSGAPLSALHDAHLPWTHPLLSPGTGS